ncbi:MAG: hypothetical protein ACK5WZ_13510 [Pseudobdellovibrionaceae bacterium]|jgi:hypothetical protein
MIDEINDVGVAAINSFQMSPPSGNQPEHQQPKVKNDRSKDSQDEDHDEDDMGSSKAEDRFAGDLSDEEILAAEASLVSDGKAMTEEEEDEALDQIDNILQLNDKSYPKFTLAKNKARFLRMVSWYRQKEEWIEVAPLSGVTKLFKQQTKELEGIRSSKLDYEMELETGTLTPSQRSYRRDELKMCKVQEKMAVHLISKLQLKIKSGRR